jgi:hypothetical protein
MKKTRKPKYLMLGWDPDLRRRDVNGYHGRNPNRLRHPENIPGALVPMVCKTPAEVIAAAVAAPFGVLLYEV